MGHRCGHSAVGYQEPGLTPTGRCWFPVLRSPQQARTLKEWDYQKYTHTSQKRIVRVFIVLKLHSILIVYAFKERARGPTWNYSLAWDISSCLTIGRSRDQNAAWASKEPWSDLIEVGESDGFIEETVEGHWDLEGIYRRHRKMVGRLPWRHGMGIRGSPERTGKEKGVQRGNALCSNLRWMPPLPGGWGSTWSGSYLGYRKPHTRKIT